DVRALRDMGERMDEGAVEAGRDPGELRRVLNVGGVITDGASEGMLRGPAGQWVDELTTLVVELGFDTFILWTEAPGQLPRFAEEIAPAVRAQVASERGPRG
ncbi:MAG TPA: LLM class flavin-dependent oxidoreductase, partial [Actinomycetota bacterium]|nr:LLM class flavin-dependent oxidoreductase [Actinomycetota bacterium]